MDPKPASASRSLIVHWMGVTDTNNAGFVHGGTVLKLADEVAGIAAARHCGCRVVTGGLDRVTFLNPIDLGEVVTLSASVNAAWRTSMEVGVRVDSENPITGERTHTSTAYTTFVALDDNGRPTPVAPVLPETPDEKRRYEEARKRRESRMKLAEELKKSRG